MERFELSRYCSLSAARIPFRHIRIKNEIVKVQKVLQSPRCLVSGSAIKLYRAFRDRTGVLRFIRPLLEPAELMPIGTMEFESMTFRVSDGCSRPTELSPCKLRNRLWFLVSIDGLRFLSISVLVYNPIFIQNFATVLWYRVLL